MPSSSAPLVFARQGKARPLQGHLPLLVIRFNIQAGNRSKYHEREDNIWHLTQHLAGDIMINVVFSSNIALNFIMQPKHRDIVKERPTPNVGLPKSQSFGGLEIQLSVTTDLSQISSIELPNDGLTEPGLWWHLEV